MSASMIPAGVPLFSTPGYGGGLIYGARYAGGAGAPSSGRAVGDTDPISALQLVNAVATTLVLSTAPRQRWGNAIDAMLPFEPAPGWSYTMPIVGGEDQLWFDTERAAFAEFRQQYVSYSAQVGNLHRFGFQGMVDQDQQRFATYWDLGQRAAGLARNIVNTDTNLRRVSLIKDTANYGTVITITPGSGNGFNLPTPALSLRKAISQICAAIETATGIDRSEFTMALLGSDAKRGALEDTEFLSKFWGYGANAVYPTFEMLATYLGIKNVVFSAPQYKPSMNDAAVPVFGSGGLIAIFYNSPNMLFPMGDLTWGRTIHFGPPDGFALNPYYKNENTSWCWPWQAYQDPRVFTTGAAGLIVGPYQTS